MGAGELSPVTPRKWHRNWVEPAAMKKQGLEIQMSRGKRHPSPSRSTLLQAAFALTPDRPSKQLRPTPRPSASAPVHPASPR